MTQRVIRTLDANQAFALARRAGFLIRLRDEAGRYLHLNGIDLTDGPTWAWCGTRAQARNLRAAWTARGDGWPFAPAPMQEDAEAG